MNRFLILGFFCFFLACKKDKGITKPGYPAGIRISDMETENDCSLDKCSYDRVRRLTAINVKAKVSIGPVEKGFVFPFTYDTELLFLACNLPDEFSIEGLEVKFSGDLFDACGYLDYGGFFYEEIYILQLVKIKKI